MKYKKLLSRWLQRDGNRYVATKPVSTAKIIIYQFGKASHIEAITLSMWGAQ